VFVIVDGSSSYSEIGKSVQVGAEFAQGKLPPLPDGSKLRLSLLDDKGSEELARKCALKAVASPDALAVIGHATSGTTAAAVEIYGPQAMPLFMPVATNPDITLEAKNRHWANVFRLVPKDDFQASTIAEFCKSKLRAKRIVVLNDDSHYGTNLGNSLLGALSNQKLEIAKHLVVDKFVDGRVNYTRYAEWIEAYAPDVLVFAGYYEEGGAFISDLRSAGCYRPIILTDGCFQSGLFTRINNQTTDIYCAFVAPDWAKLQSTEALLKYVDRPAAELTYAPFAADSIEIIFEAARNILRHNDTLDRRALLSYLAEHREYGNRLLAGPYQFDSAGDNTQGRNYLYYLTLNRNSQPEWFFLR